jgi:hypothetical protein
MKKGGAEFDPDNVVVTPHMNQYILNRTYHFGHG